MPSDADARRPATIPTPSFLLIGPYDPTGGEYTFLSPPLGVWRLAGVLRQAGCEAEVFDPNCCESGAEASLERLLGERRFDVIGFSTTGMTLKFDLALAHQAARAQRGSMLIAGGMEATFNPERLFRLAPLDLIVLGEGERPLLEIAKRLRAGAALESIPGTAFIGNDGEVRRLPQAALDRESLREAIFATPYADMPYRRYWEKLERGYRVHELPVKAEREARLAELRSVRLNTLNYCPMNCSFCSSTNFLHEAQGGSVAKVGRLDANECIAMIQRIVETQPGVRTIIFQDDIFCFTQDSRLLPLCESIVTAKKQGELPAGLQFISTNRIDAMNSQRLAAMRRAGFRVLGFGVESFARNILAEFNKAQIHPHIRPNLEAALNLGITPFLDLILTSPRCGAADLAENIRQAFYWVERGCEVGMYPYIIPFSGAKMARDGDLAPHTFYTRQTIAGTPLAWNQPAKILPLDPLVREMILDIESRFDRLLAWLSPVVPHLPSRLRSLLWIHCSIPVLGATDPRMPGKNAVMEAILRRLPVPQAPLCRKLLDEENSRAA